MVNSEALLQKISALPAARIAEIEDFVEFISCREEQKSLLHIATEASAPALAAIWEYPDDDANNS